MSLIKDIRKWFWPKKRFRRVPLEIISPYDMRDAKSPERLLMQAGVARSPDHAKRLMKRYKATNAQEVLAKLPPPRKPSLKRRLILLIRRIEGHDPRADPYSSPHSNRIDPKYRYKE